MIYADYLSHAESHRWILDTDIAWDAIDPTLARSQPDLLDRVRDSALIESYFPVFTPRALDLLWDDVNATAVFSIQLYESYKHFHVFNTYLTAVDYRPIDEAEIVDLRRRNLGAPRYDDATRLLTWYMMSEHLAAHHFMKDARQSREPVLAHILQLVGRDEVRHAQFAYDLLDLRVRANPAEADKVLDAARAFRHIGLDVVAAVPVAEPNDFAAIVTIDQRVRRLTGGRGIRADTSPSAATPKLQEATR
ncbi:MAG TPA: hypothetical protein VEA69_17895 [Tepidisphaeraceae bacterium]|nr:hypothetical protein [Tepidisphaeraceae bacterium]